MKALTAVLTTGFILLAQLVVATFTVLVCIAIIRELRQRRAERRLRRMGAPTQPLVVIVPGVGQHRAADHLAEQMRRQMIRARRN